MPGQQKLLYGVVDRVAGEVVGGLLQIFGADAVAIRNFGDVMATKGTMMNLHPVDHDLVCFGQLVDGDAGEFVAALEAPRVVVTGKALHEMSISQGE